MKPFKIILISLAVVLCCAIICFLAVNFFYYPKYARSDTNFDIAENADPDVITVVSSNVRTWAPGDLFKKSWFYRADLLLENLKATAPDIIGFQEVTPVHYKFLTKHLSGYDNVIKYRDKMVLSESCPVFYNTQKFELVDKGSFWLSETPEEMSKDWNSRCYRICSYVILRQNSDGKQLVVFNTHLDHVSEEARIKGIAVVLDKIKQFGSLPSIIMGDLNAAEDTATYKAATENFLDAKYQTDDTDSGATYQCFGERLQAENIDYFMISKTGINVLQYKVIRNTYDGVYPSDHFPIMLRITMA